MATLKEVCLRNFGCIMWYTNPVNFYLWFHYPHINRYKSQNYFLCNTFNTIFIFFQSDFIRLYMSYTLPDKFRNKNNERKIVTPPSPSTSMHHKIMEESCKPSFDWIFTCPCVCVCVCVCVFCVLQLFYLGEIINLDYDGDSESFLSVGNSFHLDMVNCSMRLHSACTSFNFYVKSVWISV